MSDGYTAKRFSGHLVLSGIICLFAAMALALARSLSPANLAGAH